MNEKVSFGTKVGRFVGNLFVICLATCISAIAIALTARFILWLF